MSEASFWDYLRVQLPKEIHYSRIESDTCPGFPDVHYTLDSVSGTIELKDAKKPGSKFPFSGQSALRGSQINWIRDEIDAGGTVFLALQKGRNIYILLADDYYEKLHKMTTPEIEQAAALAWVKGGEKPETLRNYLAGA